MSDVGSVPKSYGIQAWMQPYANKSNEPVPRSTWGDERGERKGLEPSSHAAKQKAAASRSEHEDGLFSPPSPPVTAIVDCLPVRGAC